MTKLMLGLIAVGAILVGCSSKADEAGGKPEGSAKTGSSSESFGVAECDEYFKKWEECSSKNPALKAVMSDSVKQNRDAWRTMAASPQGKDNLKQACQSASTALGDACK